MTEDFSNMTVYAPQPKTFTIDFDKVKTIEDVVVVLKSMQLHVSFDIENVPEAFKDIYSKGFLIEVKK